MTKTNRIHNRLFAALLAFIVCLTATGLVGAQTTAFTYQGRLNDPSTPPTPANGTYDFEFQLYNTNLITGVVGLPVQVDDVQVENGIFTVRLNFGADAFNQQSGLSNGRRLEIRVRPGNSSGAYEPLTPRQTITAAPFAVASLNSQQLGGVDAANVAFRNQANIFAGNQTVNGNLMQTGTTTTLNLTNGFVASGTYGTGVIPATGAGARIMFYSRRAAFRAGSVDGTQWDDANIGDRSTALGYSTIASGFLSTALGNQTIASGNDSTALGSFTTASGFLSTALGSGTTASGDYSTSLGNATEASGDYSTALGFFASTNDKSGSFVYGDSSVTSFVNATAPNQFVVRAQNIWLGKTSAVTSTANRFIETSTGAYLSTSGVWTDNSSRHLKTNFAAVDSRAVLKKVLNLPISTWSYKTDAPDIRHIGAMAQDFHRAFNVGADDEHLTAVDTAGVTMAAIQGLHAELDERAAKLQTENDVQQKIIERQQKQIDALLELVCAANPTAAVCDQKENK